jgi:hypothetical protein
MSIIPATWEAKKEESKFEISHGKNLVRPISKNKPKVVVNTCNPTWEVGVGGSQSKTSPG